MTYIRPSAPRRLLRAGAVLLYAASAIVLLVSARAGAQSSSKAQAPAKLVLETDKGKPLQKPVQPPAAGQSKDVGKKPTSTSRATQQEAAQPQDSAQAVAAAQSCDLTVLLVLDTVRAAYVNVWNYPPNTTVPVTITQTTPGIVGYSATMSGPFNPTLTLTIQTDGAGNGQSADFYIQGAQVGETITYGETPYGFTTSVGFTVLPQCNCPPIPVVQ
jgi:hypothetical protein